MKDKNMVLSEFHKQLVEILSKSGIESPDLEARILLMHHLNIEWAEIIANPGRIIGELERNAIDFDLNRRLQGEPLSRIHGTREFYGLEFALGPDTLDPRPETEIMIDRALELFHGKPPARILDLGTGTGCILITLLTKWPDCYGVGVDLSPGALATTLINANTHKVAHRVGLVCGSWGEALNGKFDLILSNPPYIRSPEIPNLESGVRNHDPILALDGGFDGLEAYKKIFLQLPGLLNPGGKALLEIGAGQGPDLMRLSRESRIRINCTHADYAGVERVVEISSGDK